MTAFCNSVMAEVSRLATMAADKQKGDFIGSISHELRSPLHGILASAEFLRDTACDNFQSSLIGTIESCGRTLLDTINHVLDFSKINAFERNWRKLRRSRMRSRSNGSKDGLLAQNMPESAPPLLNIYAVTDVAAACEEVVDGVYAGQRYQDIRNGNEDRSLLGEVQGQRVGRVVDIILDIEKADYTFTTQPGALRRVIMNIFGNALKYTAKGVIEVQLRLQDMMGAEGDVAEDGKLLVIQIIDTGKGISNEYLRTRLYTPFAQENVLAPGTGLGLSIVRSITNMLGGSIDIQSQVGQGTRVTLSLPLKRPGGIDDFASTSTVSTPSISTPSSSTPSAFSPSERAQNQSLYVFDNKIVGLYGYDPAQKVASRIAEVLQGYVSKWCGLKVLWPWTPSIFADLAIVDEEDLHALLAEKTNGLMIIALCDNASSHQLKSLDHDTLGATIEFVTKPFGPCKLARALQACLNRSPTRTVEGGCPTESGTARSNIPVDTLVNERRKSVLRNQDQTAPNIDHKNDAVIAAELAKLQLTSVSTPGRKIGGDKTSKQSTLPKAPANVITTQADDSKIENPEAGSVVPTLSDSTSDAAKSIFSERKRGSPRILLVDDNKINLRLLATFMSKRRYNNVDLAENGQIAVEAMKKRKDGYDIIFMGDNSDY